MNSLKKFCKRLWHRAYPGWRWFLGYRGPTFTKPNRRRISKDDISLDPLDNFYRLLGAGGLWRKLPEGVTSPWVQQRELDELELLAQGDAWAAFAIKEGESFGVPATSFGKSAWAIFGCVTFIGALLAHIDADPVALISWLCFFVGGSIFSVLTFGIWGVYGWFWRTYRAKAHNRLAELTEKYETAYAIYLKHVAERDMMDRVQIAITGGYLSLEHPERAYEKIVRQVHARRMFFEKMRDNWEHRKTEVEPDIAATYEEYQREAEAQMGWCDEARQAIERQIEMVRAGYQHVIVYMERIRPYAVDMIYAAMQRRAIEGIKEIEAEIETFASRHMREYMEQMQAVQRGLSELTDRVIGDSANAIPDLDPRALARELVEHEERLRVALKDMEGKLLLAPTADGAHEILDVSDMDAQPEPA